MSDGTWRRRNYAELAGGLALCLLALGCSDKKDGDELPEDPGASEQVTVPKKHGKDHLERRGGGRLNVYDPQQPKTQQPEAALQPAVPPRDLEQELRSALSSLPTCFQPRGTTDRRLSVSVTVHVTEVGVVTRSDVSAAGASLDELACARQRAEAVSFRSPVENAPLAVSASFELVQPAPVATDETEPKERVYPAGRVPPAQTLPAIGSDKRPEGWVPPAQTLPARTPAERPKGFVEPGRTLPAQGGSGNWVPATPFKDQYDEDKKEKIE